MMAHTTIVNIGRDNIVSVGGALQQSAASIKVRPFDCVLYICRLNVENVCLLHISSAI